MVVTLVSCVLIVSEFVLCVLISVSGSVVLLHFSLFVLFDVAYCVLVCVVVRFDLVWFCLLVVLVWYSGSSLCLVAALFVVFLVFLDLFVFWF